MHLIDIPDIFYILYTKAKPFIQSIDDFEHITFTMIVVKFIIQLVIFTISKFTYKNS